MIIVITGATGTGKTDIGYIIAKQFNGEIINADSRQIYRYINIANNKKIFPDTKTHLIDIKNPDEIYNIYEFRKDAQSKIKEIQNKQKISVIVGGSILYIKSLIYNMSLGSKINQPLRDTLSQESLHQLQNILYKKDKMFFDSLNNSDRNNKRRLIRYIENDKNPKEKLKLNKDYIVFEIVKDNEELIKIIRNRTCKMLKQGIIDETQNLLQMGFTKNAHALSMIGTKETIRYIENEISLRELENQINHNTIQLVKKQKTALNKIKDKKIITYENALNIISSTINKF